MRRSCVFTGRTLRLSACPDRHDDRVLGREVTYLRGLGLGDVDLARGAGSADQARGWPPSDPEASHRWSGRIAELVGTAERLEYLIERDKIALWLRTSIPALDWAAPLDLIGQGRHAQVAEVIAALEESASNDADEAI